MGRNGTDACPGGYRHVKDRNMCATRAANELKKPYNKEGCFNDFGEVGCYVAGWNNEIFFSNCDTYTTASTHYPVCQEGKMENKLTLNSDHDLFRNQKFDENSSSNYHEFLPKKLKCNIILHHVELRCNVVLRFMMF